MGLESTPSTSCRVKNPYIRSQPDQFFPIKLSTSLSPAPHHHHSATRLLKLSRQPQEHRPSPLLPCVISPSSEVHQTAHTSSPKNEEDRSSSPATIADRHHPKVGKPSSPRHPEAIGRNLIANGAM
jgi:hypothetical protein